MFLKNWRSIQRRAACLTSSTSRSVKGILYSIAGFVLFGMVAITSSAQAQTITYNYDTGTYGIGRLTSVADSTGTTTFTYDQRGNVTRTDKVIDGNTYITQRSYDSLNRVASLTYPGGEAVSYTYDPAGNLKTVGGYVTNISYNALGQRTSMSLGNGTATTYTYDSNHFRMSQLYSIGPGGAVLQNLSYGYDYVGNVGSITDGVNSANNQTFGYDHLNRLNSASSTAYGTLSYAYNQIGNMTNNSQVGSYTYPASGASSVRPHAVTTAGSNTYNYDTNGNMTSGAGRMIAYDPENRPTSITTASGATTMVYDYSGERVKKTAGGVTTTYVGSLYECVSSGCAKYIFAGSSRIALKDNLNQVYYYHGDHLGSSTVVTNSSGTSVQSLAYYPYGSTRINTGSVDVHHKFTGQELDDSTALYYYHARYYDPVIGRFIQADRVGVQLADPQTLNRYSYVLNNPLRYTDPTGENVDAAGNVVQIVPDAQGNPRLIIVGGSKTDFAGQTYIAEVDSRGKVNDRGWVANDLALAEWKDAIRAEARELRPEDTRNYAQTVLYTTAPQCIRIPEACAGGRGTASTEVGSPSGGNAVSSNRGLSSFQGTFSIEGYLGLGGGAILGRNPTGESFMSFRFGRGLGGGFSYDPFGTSPGYDPSRRGAAPTAGAGGFAEAVIGAGFFYAGASVQAGIAGQGHPGWFDTYFSPNFSAGLQDSIRLQGVYASGIEMTFYRNSWP